MLLLARGVGDDDVETAELGDGIGDELAAERLVAKVAGHGETLAAGVANESKDVLRVGLFGRQVIDDDVGTFTGKGDGGSTAHAGVAAGDERAAAGQAPGAAIAGFAVVRARVHVADEARERLRLLGERGLRIFGARVGQGLAGRGRWCRGLCGSGVGDGSGEAEAGGAHHQAA